MASRCYAPLVVLCLVTSGLNICNAVFPDGGSARMGDIRAVQVVRATWQGKRTAMQQVCNSRVIVNSLLIPSKVEAGESSSYLLPVFLYREEAAWMDRRSKTLEQCCAGGKVLRDAAA